MSGESTKSTVISVRLDNRVLKVLDRLAKKGDDTRNKLINAILMEKIGVQEEQ